jgi:starch synthase
MADQLNILLLSAEVVPFAKTGGLADVAGALPKALKSLGHDVRVAMPRYGRIGIEQFGLTKITDPYHVPLDSEAEGATLFAGAINSRHGDIPVFFIENQRLYDRDGIYMYPDDAERFIFFCRAALEGMREIGWQPDVIHCHDWHTAIVPNWLQTVYKDDEFYRNTASLYTIHNLAYQGIFGYRVLEVAGLATHGFIVHPDIPHLNDVVDFMGRGIYYADIINTVSETYAQEILTPQYGEGLDPLLRDRRDRLFGVLNGVDYELFNPETDADLPARFSRSNLEGKRICKAALQQQFGLEQHPESPVIGMVSRLSDQKGFDLIAAIIETVLQHTDAQFVLAGTGDQRYHDLFSSLRHRHPGRFGVEYTFSADITRAIYAGSDMYLMPSRMEPCGLGQLISLRYGTIPIVRATGGLADTVHDWDPRSRSGNGFVFGAYDHMALLTVIIRALETYRYREVWHDLMVRAMSADHSWEASARRYVDLYQRAIVVHRNQSRDRSDT